MARTTLIMTIALAASMLACDATAQTATAANASVKASTPTSPAQIYTAKGDSCKAQYNQFEALRWYEKALSAEVSPTAIRNVANCLYQRGAYSRCKQTMDMMPADSITTADIRMRFNVFNQLGATDSMIVTGKQILKAYPHDVGVLANLASLYNKAACPDSALALTAGYLMTDTTNISLNRQVAYSYYLKGDFKQAANEYERLLRLGDHSASTCYYAGLSYARINKKPKAYDCLKEANELYEGKNVSALSQYGIAACNIGLSQEGIECIEEALELMQPDPATVFTLNREIAKNCSLNRKYDKSIKHLKTCLELQPNNLSTIYNIALVYGAMKDTKQEKQYLQKFLDELARQQALPKAKPMSSSMVEMQEYATGRVKEIRTEEFFQSK